MKLLLRALKEIARERDEAKAIDISDMDGDDLLDIARCLGGESENALRLICEALKEVRKDIEHQSYIAKSHGHEEAVEHIRFCLKNIPTDEELAQLKEQ